MAVKLILYFYVLLPQALRCRTVEAELLEPLRRETFAMPQAQLLDLLRRECEGVVAAAVPTQAWRGISACIWRDTAFCTLPFRRGLTRVDAQDVLLRLERSGALLPRGGTVVLRPGEVAEALSSSCHATSSAHGSGWRWRAASWRSRRICTWLWAGVRQRGSGRCYGQG